MRTGLCKDRLELIACRNLGNAQFFRRSRLRPSAMIEANRASAWSAQRLLPAKPPVALVGRMRQMVRPFALEITAGGFAFAAGHAISLAVGTLKLPRLVASYLVTRP